MILSMLANHPKLDVLYNPLLGDSEHACKIIQSWTFFYNPLLDESKYVCVKVNLSTVLKVMLLQQNNQTTEEQITDADDVLESKEECAMNFEVFNAHVCKLTSYLLKARICLLVDLGIDPLNPFLTVTIQGVAWTPKPSSLFTKAKAAV